MERIDNIGLDMDGVLIDLQTYQFTRGISYFMKKLDRDFEELVVNPLAYDIEDIFGVTRDERMAFWGRKIWAYCLTFPVREGASELTHKWHDEGRMVDIITSRVYAELDNFIGFLFRSMVKIYLAVNNIYYDRLKFCREKNSGEDKAKACIEFNTSLMVDDKIDNLEAVKDIALTLCFDNNWNKEYEDENVTRVNSLYDIDDFIVNYENINYSSNNDKIMKKVL